MELEVGTVLEGKVTGVKKFGAFVALPEGKTGMVHISEVSNEFIQDLSAVLSEGHQTRRLRMSVEVPRLDVLAKDAASIHQKG